jgi:hypothetical protein
MEELLYLKIEEETKKLNVFKHLIETKKIIQCSLDKNKKNYEKKSKP